MKHIIYAVLSVLIGLILIEGPFYLMLYFDSKTQDKTQGPSQYYRGKK